MQGLIYSVDFANPKSVGNLFKDCLPCSVSFTGGIFTLLGLSSGYILDFSLQNLELFQLAFP